MPIITLYPQPMVEEVVEGVTEVSTATTTTEAEATVRTPSSTHTVRVCTALLAMSCL